MTMMQGLPLTGVSVSTTAKKKSELWMSACMSRVKGMHSLLSSIYDGIENEDAYVDEEEAEIEAGDSTQHTRMFADHCFQLINSMRETFTGPVELPLSSILNLLTRCLRVSYTDVLAVPSRTDLAQLLPSLHQCCMDVLAQLILCCGSDLLPQSHLVIEFCLQTLVSSRKMPSEVKCRTRSSAYQALCLWIQTCGWSCYLSSQSKLLSLELSADTQPDQDDKLAAKNQDEEPPIQENTSGNRRRKNEKKKKGKKGSSYFELERENREDQNNACGEDRKDVVLRALSISQHAVENLPFSTGQSIVMHIVKTATTLQRLCLHRPQPYVSADVRVGLYRSLASCLLSRLDHSGTRNDVVGHYQMTNGVLSLLGRVQGEGPEITAICSEALAVLRTSGNIKGPAIRKVTDFEDTSVEDLSEMVREKEKLEDNLEDVRQKLMNSEMENEQQSRLITSLREQLADLQSQVSYGKTESSSKHHKLETPQGDSSEEEEEEEMEAEEEDEEKGDSSKNLAVEKVENGISPKTGQSDSNKTCDKDKQSAASSKEDLPSSLSCTGDKLVAKSQETSKEKWSLEPAAGGSKRTEDTLKADQTKTPSKNASKRVNANDVAEDNISKRPKTDNSGGTSTQSAGVEDMLLDFVDALPDP